MELTEQQVGLNYYQVKAYAQFLIEHKLPEAALTSIALSKEHNLSVLGYFAYTTDEELAALILPRIKAFYQQLQQGTAYEGLTKTIDDWKQDQDPLFPKGALKDDDIILYFNIRRQVLVEFLPYYTVDPAIFAAIHREIERVFNRAHKYFIQAYLDINQEELHKKNDFLSSLIEHSEHGIVVYDKDLKILEWNAKFERQSGIKKADILGKQLSEVIPAHKDSKESNEILEAFATGQKVYISDRQFKSFDGWYDGYAIPLYNKKQGEVTEVLCIAHDISERKKAELILKEQQQKLEETNNALSQKIIELEHTKQVLQQNESRLREAQIVARVGHWEYNFENPAASFYSESLYDNFETDKSIPLSPERAAEHVYPEDVEHIRETVSQAYKSGQPYTVVYRITTPTGKHKTLVGKGIPVKDQQGKTIGLKGITQDITERVQVEKELRESKQLIQVITDSVPNIIFVYDLQEQKNVYINREVTTLLGYTAEEVANMGNGIVDILVHPDDLPMVRARDQKFLTEKPTSPVEIICRLKHANGEWRWIRSIEKIFKYTNQGVPRQILGISEDITERKKIEEEIIKTNQKLTDANQALVLNEQLLTEANNALEERVQSRTAELIQKNRQLERINSDLDTFVYTASHDLKSPITNMEGLMMAIDRKIRPGVAEEENTLLDMMNTSVKRLRRTIQELTEVINVQKELTLSRSEKLHVPSLLEDVQLDIEGLISVTGAQISYRLEVEEIFFPRKDLRSVLLNLLTNAIKYHVPGTTPYVHVQAVALPGGIELTVQDNGIGIPANQQDKIFTLFKRVSTYVEGSGIGLYLVKKIIEGHNGSIRLISEPGKGTTFIVYLPEEAAPTL